MDNTWKLFKKVMSKYAIACISLLTFFAIIIMIAIPLLWVMNLFNWGDGDYKEGKNDFDDFRYVIDMAMADTHLMIPYDEIYGCTMNTSVSDNLAQCLFVFDEDGNLSEEYKGEISLILGDVYKKFNVNPTWNEHRGTIPNEVFENLTLPALYHYQIWVKRTYTIPGRPDLNVPDKEEVEWIYDHTDYESKIKGTCEMKEDGDTQYRCEQYREEMSVYPFHIPTESGYRITSRFGYRNNPLMVTNEDPIITYHNATDYAKARGVPIKAATNGIVVSIGSEAAGNPVVVESNLGGFTFYLRYTHMDTYSVQIGQEIEWEETIGQMGDAGYATGPHLHLAAFVVKDGIEYYFNPMILMGYASEEIIPH